MGKWDQLASEGALKKTIRSLENNGFSVQVVENGLEARKKVLSFIPDNAQILNMTSMTLEQTGIASEILQNPRFAPVRKKLESMDRKTQNLEMQRIGTAPEWAIGSVHAITQDGQVVIASNTGSQLPAYAYGSPHVVWVVSTAKIVSNLDDARKRVYEYSLPLEDNRMKKAFGSGSFVSKLLTINREIKPDRITIFFVKEKLGF